jgi:hypothetical protein
LDFDILDTIRPFAFGQSKIETLRRNQADFIVLRRHGLPGQLLLQVVNRLLNCIHIHMSSEHLVYTTSFNKLRNAAREENHLLYIIFKTEVREKGLGPQVKRGVWSRDPNQ